MSIAMIRTLRPEEAAIFGLLRREYLEESPLVFESSPDSDEATVEAVRQVLGSGPESVIIGAFEPELVGVVAVYRSPKRKASHKAHLWGMYVTPPRRGQGIGNQLLQAAIEHARERLQVEWIHLTVTSAAPEARRLYEQSGFRVWGTEPDALRHDGQSVDEHYLSLHLPPNDVRG